MTADVKAIRGPYGDVSGLAAFEKSTTPGEPGLYRAADKVRNGAYAFHDDDIWFVCPCGCREVSWIPVKIGDKESGSWKWNGDQDHPVVAPSIQKNYGCRWHGYLGAPDGSKPGVWTTC